MTTKYPILFLSLFCFLSSPFLLQAKCPNKQSRRDSRADYIIVGVGTAGAVLAKKLTDDHKTSVIALHIGENLTDDPLIKFSKNTPLTVAAGLIGQPPLYHSGDTIPQPQADNRQLSWVYALPQGGASSINAGAYCRGTNELYAQWEAIAGPLWSVKRILGIYRELEDYEGETPNPKFRGYHGPLHIRQVAHPTPLAIKFTNATIQATGFPFVVDYNDPKTPIGVSSQLQYTQKGRDGALRVSSATAFLNRKIMTPEGLGVGKRSLRVLFKSTALRTIWKGNRAIGVEYLRHGKIKKVFANKGVIVSAGLQSSPFLLHSGIGPRSLLESLQIPVVFDNPNVGEGLADQPAIRMLFLSNPADTPLIEPNGLFAQISWLPTPNQPQSTIRQLRLATVNPIPGLTLGLFDLCQPLSRGNVTINNADPLAPPVINLGVLSNSNDLNLFIQGFQTYIKAINQTLQESDSLYRLIYPDPAILDDVNALATFIQENIESNEHFQSHCRMAPLDQGGVVDSTGHVYGVQNLLVADNSIVPLCMDGSPMASAYLIAANIAKLLGAKEGKPPYMRFKP